MLRRTFLHGLAATGLALRLEGIPPSAGGASSAERLVTAARAQVGVTTGYDPRYTALAYPNGDVPRSTGVCADVIVRAARDGLGLDLQKLVHEDMLQHFAAYPRIAGMRRPDSNIDHRRVLNLEAYWKRSSGQIWTAASATPGDAFPGPLVPGDFITWLLGGSLPHIAIVSSVAPGNALLVHNIGRGAEEIDLAAFHGHRARGHFRWPAAV